MTLTGGKCLSVEDFYDRVDLTRDAPETLVKSGALDRVARLRNRREGVYVLQGITTARNEGFARTAPHSPWPT